MKKTHQNFILTHAPLVLPEAVIHWGDQSAKNNRRIQNLKHRREMFKNLSLLEQKFEIYYERIAMETVK